MYTTFAWRYFKAKKSTNAINIIAWVSVTAIMVGTAALIILLSAFNGLEGLVKSLYTDFQADMRVIPVIGNTITVTDNQLKQVSQIPGIKGYSLVMEEKAILQNGEYQSIVSVKGVDTGFKKVVNIHNKLIHGAFELGTADHPAAVLGVGVESNVSVISEKELVPLTIYLPRKDILLSTTDPLQSLSADAIATTGTFSIQQDFDNKYIITNIGFIKRMLNMRPDEYGSLELKLNEAAKEKEIRQQLTALFPSDKYIIQTRYEQNSSLYSVMQMERWIIYSILSLILVVGAFTMIDSLTMLVLEKQKDIQVLKALGADDVLIQKIFLSEGMLLAFIGGTLGMLLAIFICWIQMHFHVIPLQDTFVVNYYPVKMMPRDFVLVLATVFIVAWLASWLPAKKAAKQAVELRA